jgi:toxin FitB
VSYLLDTNVVSELVRSKPNPGVVAWLQGVPDGMLHLSVVSLGELRSGVERLGVGPRREKMRVWLERELADWFEDRSQGGALFLGAAQSPIRDIM